MQAGTGRRRGCLPDDPHRNNFVLSCIRMETYRKKTALGTDVVVCVYKDEAVTSATAPNAETNNGPSSRFGGAAGKAADARPTALLLGWYGASEKNLNKYAQLYSNMGYNTVCTSSPTSVTFSITHTTPLPFLLSILRVLAADSRLLSGGLIIMAFSNAGSILIPRLAQFYNRGNGPDEALKADPNFHPEDVPVVEAVIKAWAGLAFDSGPCYLHADIGARALTRGLRVADTLLGHIITVLFLALARLRILVYGDISARFWRSLRSAEYPCPEIYMYSTKDDLMDEEALDELIDYRQKSGLSKGMHIWRVEDAGHVQLLRAHRQAYVHKLEELNSWATCAYREKHGLSPWVPPEEDER